MGLDASEIPKSPWKPRRFLESHSLQSIPKSHKSLCKMSLTDDVSRGTTVKGHGVKSGVLVLVTVVVMGHREQKPLEEEQV